MSKTVPLAVIDKEHRDTIQRLIECTGGPAWDIRLVRVDDTHIRFEMVGSDGQKRVSSNITLS